MKGRWKTFNICKVGPRSIIGEEIAKGLYYKPPDPENPELDYEKYEYTCISTGDDVLLLALDIAWYFQFPRDIRAKI